MGERYPHNYLVAQAKTCWYRINEDRQNEHLNAALAVRCAPRYFQAWQELSWALHNEADAIRNRRTIGEMNATELS